MNNVRLSQWAAAAKQSRPAAYAKDHRRSLLGIGALLGMLSLLALAVKRSPFKPR
jgi:hypothetical protein